MMSLDTKNFESQFGFNVPESIVELLTNDSLREQMPTRFRLKNNLFVLELQYFLDISNIENYDVSRGRFKFSVTTDGFELLVDLNSKSLDILQDEFGEVDRLGVSIKDLIEADKEPM